MSNSWLYDEIRDGLAALFILRLPGAPASDTLEAVIRTWTAAIGCNRTFDRVRDTPRIREAFLRLAAHQVNWPAPRSLLDAMPPIPAQRRLAPPTASGEAAARAMAEISEVLWGGTPPRAQEAPTEPPTASHDPGYLRGIEADLRRHYDRKRAAAGDRDDPEDLP